ncbi:MAG: U32 family peptidase [Bacteroidales bacterium]|nr:U32 family peptidase [Bacteroidales bacterium]
MKKIELLAPARDAEVGIEAFNHGADAVYIGSPRFGARAAAGNTVADIERLARHGHQFGARTMVALNTILDDRELEEAQRLAWQLYEAGVDSLIVQDLGLFGIDMPPIELHASTQCDNRTPEKVRLMHQLGASRVVLARELSLAEITAIHNACPEVELECFVHGALCVCISGQCYLSASINGRSANRGECAQPCRLPMDLLDEKGNLLVSQKHLLSLRDMNRSSQLEQLLLAGVTSLKIEGRLKDLTYVKNVVAYYRKQIDALIEKHPDWEPVSMGRCTYTFEPQPDKAFNRGFTQYFADGQREVMWNHDSPKSMGEEMGVVSKVGKDCFEYQLSAATPLHNGDGVVSNTTIGFRANRVEGNRVWPLNPGEVLRQLRPGMSLRRNLDVQFDALLQKPSAKRKMAVLLEFDLSGLPTVTLSLCQNPSLRAQVSLDAVFEPAQKPQAEVYERQLGKLGESNFFLEKFSLVGQDNLYIPGSTLNQLRREACEKLNQVIIEASLQSRLCEYHIDCRKAGGYPDGTTVLPSDYKANIHNRVAAEIMHKMGVKEVEQSFESKPRSECTVMQTRYCLRQALGQCAKYPLNPAEKQRADALLKGKKIGAEAMLKIGDEKFILKFGCNNLCISEIMRTFARKT